MATIPSDVKKETPSLKRIFVKEEASSPDETQQQEEIVPDSQEPVSTVNVRAKLDAYLVEKNVTGTVKIILSKPIQVEESSIKLTINNSVEISMIEKIEVELLGYLRSELKNSGISFNYEVTEDKEERRPYTSEEKFKAMAKKNPALLKLADEFGLDTDH